MVDRPAPPRTPPPRSGVVLCADDYAMTNGVSRAVIELADAGRLSATSVMTTSQHWPSHATWVARVRDRIAVGLHFSLTLGRPLAAMPRLAPEGRFPAVDQVVAGALKGSLVRDEIAAEFERQLVAFEAEIGLPPDHIDGHQHVHALPVVRDAVLDVLTRRFTGPMRPLIRDPADRLGRIVRRGRSWGKAMTLTWLSAGLRARATAGGFPLNEGFAGVSNFSPTVAEADFAAAVTAPGARHLVMCHPGYVDDDLARLDPVTTRRKAEYDALLRGRMPCRLWHPSRSAVGGPVDWKAEWRQTSAEDDEHDPAETGSSAS